MNIAAQTNVSTEHVQANGTSYAYRRFGAIGGTPLILLMHFRGTIAHWDPMLLDRMSGSRTLILLDNAGVGESSGEIPDSIDGMADHALAAISALGFEEIDLLGFSMGGYVAQVIALRKPNLVRRLILAGTGPGSSLQIADPRVKRVAGEPHLTREHMSFLFFPENETGASAGANYWERLGSLPGGRAAMVSGTGIMRQAVALKKWNEPDGGSFHRLAELKLPVLVANGDDDVMVSTESSIRMARALPNAQLMIFPNSGHGFLFQYPELFANYVNSFLSSKELEDSSG